MSACRGRETWHDACEANVALARWVVNGLLETSPMVRRFGLDDAMGAACLALAVAAKTFDAARGVRFSTYAVRVIQREVMRSARHAGAITVPAWYGRKGASARRYHRQAEDACRRWAPPEVLETQPARRP